MADFAYYEFMATTRLGYTMQDFARAYLGEVLRKARIYKLVFNLEKYAGYEMEQETGSLEDL